MLVWQAGARLPKLWAASLHCSQQLCSLIDLPHALPAIPIDDKETIRLHELFAKVFFLEFLERQLDSSKYSFKSHWSICYGATVIAQVWEGLLQLKHTRERQGPPSSKRHGQAAPGVWNLHFII